MKKKEERNMYELFRIEREKIIKTKKKNKKKP